MKKYQKTWTGALLIAMLIVSQVACATSEYASASQAYDVDSQTYTTAGNAVQAHAATLTPDQNARFISAQAEVRDADKDVYAALMVWKSSGTKPGNYDALAAHLRAAQQKVIDLSKEVSK